MDCPRVGGVRLLDRPRMEPSKQGVVLIGSWVALRGALKRRSCSGLDSWIVHGIQVLYKYLNFKVPACCSSGSSNNLIPFSEI